MTYKNRESLSELKKKTQPIIFASNERMIYNLALDGTVSPALSALASDGIGYPNPSLVVLTSFHSKTAITKKL